MASLSNIKTNETQAQRGMVHEIRFNLSRAMIITRREVIDMFRDWRILAPILVLTLIFPTIANWGAGRMVQWVAEYGASIVGERLIPFLMMVVGFFPISFSLIIALESFVGEKERRSLEPLLSTPMSNLQLYIGKILSSTIPPITGSLLGITVYLVGVYFNVGWVPSFTLLLQVLLLTLMQALVMVSGAVVVSSQTTSVRAANLLASFIIIPMAFLIQAEALIMFWGQYGVLWWILFGLLLVNIVLVRMGVQVFNREQLLGSDIDDLNLFASVKTWGQMTIARRQEGPRRSFWHWYRTEVLAVAWQMRMSVTIVLIAMVGAVLIGRYYGQIYRIPADIFVTENWYERFTAVLNATGFTGLSGVMRVIFQNVRALAIASVLGMFTFGVLAALILMLPTGIVGFLIPQMVVAGMDIGILWAALLPHSLFEIPAALLAGGAAVRLGASVIAPPPGKTLGEGWMIALADTTRIWVALVLPLVVLAALVEIFITPTVVLMIVGAG